MPCYERRYYKNVVITDGGSTVDVKAMETGVRETGLQMETRGRKLVIRDKETGRLMASLEGNELTMEQSSQNEADTERIRQAYSVGVAYNAAKANYWSPVVQKVGNTYEINCEVNY